MKCCGILNDNTLTDGQLQRYKVIKN